MALLKIVGALKKDIQKALDNLEKNRPVGWREGKFISKKIGTRRGKEVEVRLTVTDKK